MGADPQNVSIGSKRQHGDFQQPRAVAPETGNSLARVTCSRWASHRRAHLFK